VTAIDHIRVLTGVAVIIETHAPHAASSGHRDLRPIGSSVWLRWPEFGHGLRPVADEGPDAHEFHPFRGDRDRRDWPKVLYKNAKPWPWHAVMS
jgi:replicative DNA helicase